MIRFARATFLAALASAGAIGVTVFGGPACAGDLIAGTVAGFRYPERPRVLGRPVPDCSETRPGHLIVCAPREVVLILPDEPVANAVYTPRPPHPRRPYPQLFVWGP